MGYYMSRTYRRKKRDDVVFKSSYKKQLINYTWRFRIGMVDPESINAQIKENEERYQIIFHFMTRDTKHRSNYTKLRHNRMVKSERGRMRAQIHKHLQDSDYAIVDDMKYLKGKFMWDID